MTGNPVPFFHRYALPMMWLSWALYWWAQSRDVKIAVRRESFPSRLLHIVPLAAAVFLLGTSRPLIGILNGRFLPSTEWPFWVGSLLTAAGLLFTVWARRHLGQNWSGTVTIKSGHELITTGPYALVRHPIYAGLLLAFLGAAVALGEWRGVLAVALAATAFWLKLRLEERWMRQQFGDAYVEYARRVSALVPFIL